MIQFIGVVLLIVANVVLLASRIKLFLIISIVSSSLLVAYACQIRDLGFIAANSIIVLLLVIKLICEIRKPLSK